VVLVVLVVLAFAVVLVVLAFAVAKVATWSQSCHTA